VYINTIAIRLVVLPLALKNVAINVPELSFAARLVVPPVSFIASSIWPHLNTVTMLHVAKPLTLVDGSILKYDFALLLELEVLYIAICELALIDLPYNIINYKDQ
jgi:hypothetical protein